MGLTAVKKKAIALEVQAIASAVNQYKNKYGDFPPDGSNAAAFERHFRKIFPQIQASEFTTLYANVDPPSGAPATVVMDPAEALVFCLGGYSSNPTQPFTGTGGPLSLVPGSTERLSVQHRAHECVHGVQAESTDDRCFRFSNCFDRRCNLLRWDE